MEQSAFLLNFKVRHRVLQELIFSFMNHARNGGVFFEMQNDFLHFLDGFPRYILRVFLLSIFLQRRFRFSSCVCKFVLGKRTVSPIIFSKWRKSTLQWKRVMNDEDKYDAIYFRLRCFEPSLKQRLLSSRKNFHTPRFLLSKRFEFGLSLSLYIFDMNWNEKSDLARHVLTQNRKRLRLNAKCSATEFCLRCSSVKIHSFQNHVVDVRSFRGKVVLDVLEIRTWKLFHFIIHDWNYQQHKKQN